MEIDFIVLCPLLSAPTVGTPVCFTQLWKLQNTLKAPGLGQRSTFPISWRKSCGLVEATFASLLKLRDSL